MSHRSDKFELNQIEDLNNRNVFTGLMKEAGETEHSIVELHWINMDILAMLTQDEENNLYIETYFLEGGVSTVCDKMQLCEMSGFETVKV